MISFYVYKDLQQLSIPHAFATLSLTAAPPSSSCKTLSTNQHYLTLSISHKFFFTYLIGKFATTPRRRRRWRRTVSGVEKNFTNQSKVETSMEVWKQSSQTLHLFFLLLLFFFLFFHFFKYYKKERSRVKVLWTTPISCF